jgi:sucrose-6-phosphate hydrolase SacC (GH32 family)
VIRNRDELIRPDETSWIKVESRTAYVANDTAIEMRIFVDRSIIEVYLYGSSYTTRVFPSRPATGLGWFSTGDAARIDRLEIWTMDSMWDTES